MKKTVTVPEGIANLRGEDIISAYVRGTKGEPLPMLALAPVPPTRSPTPAASSPKQALQPVRVSAPTPPSVPAHAAPAPNVSPIIPRSEALSLSKAIEVVVSARRNSKKKRIQTFLPADSDIVGSVGVLMHLTKSERKSRSVEIIAAFKAEWRRCGGSAERWSGGAAVLSSTRRTEKDRARTASREPDPAVQRDYRIRSLRAQITRAENELKELRAKLSRLVGPAPPPPPIRRLTVRLPRQNYGDDT